MTFTFSNFEDRFDIEIPKLRVTKESPLPQKEPSEDSLVPYPPIKSPYH